MRVRGGYDLDMQVSTVMSVTVLRGRIWDKKIKKSESWDQEVLYKLCLMPSKLIQQYSILYTISRGKWDKVNRKLSHNGMKSVGSYSSNVAQREHRISHVCHRPGTQQPWE